MLKKRNDGRLQKSITLIKGGVKKRKYFYGKTRREIDQKILNYKTTEHIGRKFFEVAEEWKSKHIPTVALGTAKAYNPAVERAIAQFGTTPIKKITPSNINNFLLDFAKKGMSRKSVNNQKIVLNQIFRYAVIKEDIKYNPVIDVTIPKNLPRSKRRVLALNEIEIIKNSVDKTFGFFFFFPFVHRSSSWRGFSIKR